MGLNNILLIVLMLFCIIIVYILYKQKSNFSKKFVESNESILSSLQNFSNDFSNKFDNQGNLLSDIRDISSLSKELVSAPFQQLSFEDTLDLTKFGNEIKSTELVRCSNQLIDSYRLSVSKSAQLVESINKMKDGSIVWGLSKEGKKLLKSGKIKFAHQKGTNKILSTLQDAKTGNWAKQIKGIKISHAAKAAKLANVAVNAAHIIAGIDQMNKLKEIDRKISFLVEGRKIDKLSNLKANFRVAKELFDQPIGQHERAQLLGIHRDLLKLREIWFSEIEYKLENIKDPKSLDFFKRTFFTTTKGKDKKITDQVSDFQDEINFINATLFLDVGLCYGINHKSSLQDDLSRIDQIESSMNEKAKYLSGKNDLNLDADLKKIEFIKNSYMSFKPLSGDMIDAEI
jgi:hypothetical protein